MYKAHLVCISLLCKQTYCWHVHCWNNSCNQKKWCQAYFNTAINFLIMLLYSDYFVTQLQDCSDTITLTMVYHLNSILDHHPLCICMHCSWATRLNVQVSIIYMYHILDIWHCMIPLWNSILSNHLMVQRSGWKVRVHGLYPGNST